MTIGIAAHGDGAGLAAFRALAAVENVGRGAIGGFVSFVVIAADGAVHRAETQRGGTTTLFTEGEETGVAPPPLFADARYAALMSSGPNRPDPLAQFTPAEAGGGLVSGHRLPNRAGVDGRPLNVAVLDALCAGDDARTAVEAVLNANPGSDAGLIALDVRGGLFAANSAFVAKRGDLGMAVEHRGRAGCAVAVLHNAIHPHRSLAALAADVALDSMNPADRQDFTVQLSAGTPLMLAERNAVHIDGSGCIMHVCVSESSWLEERFEGAAINFEALVCRDGAVIGHTVSEPYCVAEGGRLVTMSGRDLVAIGVRRVREHP